jgi:pyrroline-5-carboxylate reductase
MGDLRKSERAGRSRREEGKGTGQGPAVRLSARVFVSLRECEVVMGGERLNLVVIGGGNMGGAIVEAALRGRAETDDLVRVAEPDMARRERLVSGHSGAVVGYASAAGAMSAAGPGARVLIAVKPQMFAGVAGELTNARVASGRLFISIMAGVRAAAVYERLGGEGSQVRVMRAMPNLGLSVGEGMTCVCEGPGARRADVDFTAALFEKGGRVVAADEDLFDAFTAVASSGLAYVFYLAQAMVEAGVAVGFDRAASLEMVRQTVVGAGAILARRAEEPGALVAGVKSKGGTTEAALGVLEERGVAEAVVSAIEAARDRGRELGR